MSSAKGVREVSHVDCAGGGQIVVDRGIAYIGHMASPHGTSIIDVRDPKHPKPLAELQMPVGTHSHKVRVSNGLMIVNHEAAGEPPAGWRGGFGVYDVSDPSKPREITRWQTAGTGMHRFDFDGRYLYGSPTFEGSRQCHGHLRPAGPFAAAGGRALVDAGAVDRGRRDAELEGHHAPLPSPAAVRQSPLYQLLAGRLRHPRH